MKLRFARAAALAVVICGVQASVPVWAGETPVGVPAGYTLRYSQDFTLPGAAADFNCTDPAAWRISRTNGLDCLELFGASKYTPPHRSPFNIALLKTLRFGSFVMDVKFLQTGKDYGHRDMCVFFNVQSPTHYYYAHVATKVDKVAHQIHIVNDAPRTKISTHTTAGVDWGRGDWHTVRVVRDAAGGRIAIYFDDMSAPIMEANDKTFVDGYVGFGSFDDTGCVSGIRIYAPETAAAPAGFFKALKP